MTSVDVSPAERRVQRRNKSNPLTGKIARAVQAMVWDALPRKQAAQAAGVTEHGLYKALRKPAVKAAYLGELEVLRTSERARNIHRAIEIRDAANNKPAMEAIKWLHQIDEQTQQGSAASMPGFVIVLGVGEAPTIKTIEHDKLAQYDGDKKDQ
jgi:hypothetical protein